MLSLCLGLHPSLAHAAQEPDPLQDLFYKGTAEYSAADYAGAIKTFTEALALATQRGSKSEIRSALLVNLARAHVKLYGVEEGAKQLRSAREVYTRVIEEADGFGYPESDVAMAKEGLAEVERLLAAHEDKQAAKTPAPAPVAVGPASEGPAAQPSSPSDPASDGGGDRNPRRAAAIASLSVGSVFVAGGVVSLIWGSTFESHANQSIADTDNPAEDVDTYRNNEIRKGRIWMGVGGAAAAVGLAGVVTGAVLLVRGNKGPGPTAWRISPMLSRQGGGVGVSGRF